MKTSTLFLLLLCFYGVKGQIATDGVVISKTTKQPLPFATVGFKGKAQGTITNKNGEFRLQVPAELRTHPLVVSYLGYESYEINPAVYGSNMTIVLTESFMQLDEIVVRPLSPTDYIIRAVKRMSENYPSDPFATNSYYREKFVENGNFLNLTEGYFKSYYPSYQDTIENQHQLLLHRRVEDVHDLAFMRDWIEKKQQKEKRKAKKKGEEYEEEDVSEEIKKGFGGPENTLSMDLMKSLEPCLDSTLFKKFRYTFANGVQYRDRELLVIDFETKRVVEHTRQKGKIFIDLKTDAIVAVEYSGALVIPAVVKPILLAFGLSIKDPRFDKKIRYQLVKDRWYPENFQWYVDLGIKKRYMFKSNEYSDFEAEQVLQVSNIKFSELEEIAEEKRFDSGEEMAKQQFNDEKLTWDKVNTLKPEKTL